LIDNKKAAPIAKIRENIGNKKETKHSNRQNIIKPFNTTPKP